MAETEMEVMQLQIEEHQGWPATARSWEEAWKDSSLQVSERVWPCDTLISVV